MDERLRPSFWRVPQHSLRAFRGLSPLAFAGLLMVALNVPVGWGGAALCAFMGAHGGSRVWYVAAGVVYALSWGMLGLGLLLAGPPVVSRFRRRCRSAWRAWRRGHACSVFCTVPNK